jgi:hypothetical protein
MKTLDIRLVCEDQSQDWQKFSVELRYLVAQATIDEGIRAVSANPARLVPTTKVVAEENTTQAVDKNAKTANNADAPPETEKVGATQRMAVTADGAVKFVLPTGAEVHSAVVLAPDRSPLAHFTAKEMPTDENGIITLLSPAWKINDWEPTAEELLALPYLLRGKLMATDDAQTLAGLKVWLYVDERLIAETISDANGGFKMQLASRNVKGKFRLAEMKTNASMDIDVQALRDRELVYFPLMNVKMEERSAQRIAPSSGSDLEAPKTKDEDDYDYYQDIIAAKDCDCKNPPAPPRSLPDAEDFEMGGYSRLVGDDCQHFNKPDQSVRELLFYKILRTSNPLTRGFGYNRNDGAMWAANWGLHSQNGYEPFDWNPEQWKPIQLQQACDFSYGVLLLMKQTYKANGHSLGQLLYSLPLAPGQKKQIAILDWSRIDESKRTESQDYSEELRADLSRSRDISDVVEGVVKEHTSGSSQMDSKTTTWGVGVSAGVPLGPVSLGVSANYGESKTKATANTEQNSSRNSSLSALNKLRDSTAQSAASVRSQRSTVVQTTKQSEHVMATTEVVANHNHGHSLTMEYFEVLAHYWVEQKFLEARECLFVPLLYKHFTLQTLGQFGDILRNHFKFDYRHPAFAGFEAAERMIANEIKLEGTITNPIDTANTEIIKNMTVELQLAIFLSPELEYTDEKRAYTTGAVTQKATSRIVKAQSLRYQSILTPESIGIVKWEALEGKGAAAYHFTNTVAPAIAKLFVQKLKVTLEMKTGSPITGTATLISSYSKGDVLKCNLNFALPNGHSIKPSDIASIKIEVEKNLEVYAGANLIALKMSVTTANYPNVPLIDVKNINKSLSVDKTATFEWYSATVGTITPIVLSDLENQTTTDRRAVRGLLRHLNEHTEYYHAAVWRNLDEYRRYNLLDGMAYNMPNPASPNGYDWISVASIVENTLVDIVGNSLVFPVARGLRINPTFAPTMDLTTFYKPASEVEGFGISVPTPGLFAEAILGACNAAELVDDKRAQDWTKFTADEPTGIDSLNTDSRYQAPPNMDTKDMPQPIINIQNAPAAPDPQGMNALSSILNNGNLFRDATGMEALSQLTTEQIRAVTQNNAKLSDSANLMAENAHQYNMNKQAVKDGLLHPSTAAAAARKQARENAKTQSEKHSDAYNRQVADINGNAKLTDAQKQAAIAALTDNYAGADLNHETKHNQAVAAAMELGAGGEMEFYENGQVKNVKNGESAPEEVPTRVTALFQLKESLRPAVYAQIAYAYNEPDTTPDTTTPPTTGTGSGIDDGTGGSAVVAARMSGSADTTQSTPDMIAALEDYFAQGNAVLVYGDGRFELAREEEGEAYPLDRYGNGKVPSDVNAKGTYDSSEGTYKVKAGDTLMGLKMGDRARFPSLPASFSPKLNIGSTIQFPKVKKREAPNPVQEGNNSDEWITIKANRDNITHELNTQDHGKGTVNAIQFLGNVTDFPASIANDNRKERICESLYKIEGYPDAINTFDGNTTTLGPGFMSKSTAVSSKGLSNAMEYLKRLLQKVEIANDFEDYGVYIDVSSGKISMYNDEGKILTNEETILKYLDTQKVFVKVKTEYQASWFYNAFITILNSHSIEAAEVFWDLFYVSPTSTLSNNVKTYLKNNITNVPELLERVILHSAHWKPAFVSCVTLGFKGYTNKVLDATKTATFLEDETMLSLPDLIAQIKCFVVYFVKQSRLYYNYRDKTTDAGVKDGYVSRLKKYLNKYPNDNGTTIFNQIFKTTKPVDTSNPPRTLVADVDYFILKDGNVTYYLSI